MEQGKGFLAFTAKLPLFDGEYEPVYGLPKRSVEEWLARNPQLRERYERMMQARIAALGAG
jgi:hypothetical protein